MNKDELRVNSPVSRLHVTLPPENQDHWFRVPVYVLAGRGSASDHSRVPESRDCSRNSKEPSADDARSCFVLQ